MKAQSPIVIGCDHAAYDLKELLKQHIEQSLGIPVEDMGTHSLDSVNYPDFGHKVAEAVSSGRFDRGILMCGTGIGMSMVANRYTGVRAALCNDLFSASMSRKHNDANILVMGARLIGDVLARAIVETWLETPFEGGRHQGRIDMFNSGCRHTATP